VDEGLYCGSMSWDEVFAELQAQFEAAEHLDARARVLELAEAEAAGIRMADRLRSRRGEQLWIRVADGSDRTGEVRDVAEAWVVLADGPRRCLIPREAIVLVSPLGGSAPQPDRIERSLSLGHVLRALAQQGLAVTVHTAAGAHRGRIARVGADHLDLVQTQGVLTVPWSGLVSVESFATGPSSS